MNTTAFSNAASTKPRSGILHWCGSNTHAFFQNTYLHGLKFAGERKLTLWENALFIIIFLICIVFGVYQAIYVFEKWQNTPVIIGIESQATALTDMPFPTITICNMNQLKASKAAKLRNNTIDDAIQAYLCRKPTDFSRFKNVTANDGISILNFLLQNSHSCADLILHCIYDSTEIACTDIFREVITDEGLCCIFNALHPYYLFKGDYYYIRQFTSTNGAYETPTSWSPSKGYPRVLPKRYYPRKVAGVGVSRGLTIVLNAYLNDYYCSTTNGAGFKVLLYNPVDEPNMRETGLPLMLGHQTKVRISIKNFEAHPSVRSISPQRRQCYFEDEKPLLYYKLYTRRNCERECDALFFYERCQCIPYYLPLIFSNTSACYLAKFNCVRSYEQLVNDTDLTICREKCLPGCFDVAYFPDMFRAPLQFFDIQDELLRNYTSQYVQDNIAVVHFYYQSDDIRSFMKRTYTGATEYLSLTGGIMSLMIGFSVLSIVELIYFFIFRPIASLLQSRALRNVIEPVEKIETNRFEQHFKTHSENPFRYRNRRLRINEIKNVN